MNTKTIIYKGENCNFWNKIDWKIVALINSQIWGIRLQYRAEYCKFQNLMFHLHVSPITHSYLKKEQLYSENELA